MAARQYHYAESLGAATNNTTTYSDVCTLTFTPDASSTYLLLWSAIHYSGSTTVSSQARLQNTTAGTTLSEVIQESQDTTDRNPAFGSALVTVGGSPASTTFKVQLASSTAATTCTMTDARLVAIKLDAADQSTESDAQSTTTSGTYQTKATLTWTPATTGDYLLLAFAEVQNTSNGDQFSVKLQQTSGSAYGEMDAATSAEGMWRKDARDRYPWGTLVKLNLSNSSKTFTVQYKNTSNAGDTIAIRRARIVALRLDTLDANYYAEDRARGTSTSASYQDQATATQTPAAQDHLLLAGQLFSGTSTTLSNYATVEDGGTTIAEALIESQQPRNLWSLFTASVATYAASSRTWRTRTRSETTSTTTASLEAAVAVLQLTAGGASVEGAAALTATATLAAAGQVAVAGQAALTASATMAVAGEVLGPQVTGSAALTATATVAASGQVAVAGVAALTASASVAATGQVAVAGVAALTATATMDAAATVARLGAAALTAEATMAASGLVAVRGVAALTALANMNVAATVQELVRVGMARGSGASQGLVSAASAGGEGSDPGGANLGGASLAGASGASGRAGGTIGGMARPAGRRG